MQPGSDAAPVLMQNRLVTQDDLDTAVLRWTHGCYLHQIVATQYTSLLTLPTSQRQCTPHRKLHAG